MENLRQKRARLQPSREEYDELRRRVLERDGWRSQGGDDEFNNLIALCAACYRLQHRV